MADSIGRFALPLAYADPAFHLCLHESIDTPELVSNFDRLYKRTLATKHTPDDMGEFVKFVHDCIYLRLPDEAIDSLRATALTQPAQGRIRNAMPAAHPITN